MRFGTAGAGRLATRTSGRAARVIAASVHSAPIQPNTWISRCEIGAKANWPNDPPALMMPAACAAFFRRKVRRRGADQHREAAGPRTHGGEETERDDEAEPRGHEGRHRVPSDSSTMPATRTLADPYRSATAPATGLDHAPHQLPDGEREADRRDAERGRAVERRYEQPHGLPRAPIVTIRIAAAATVTTQVS